MSVELPRNFQELKHYMCGVPPDEIFKLEEYALGMKVSISKAEEYIEDLCMAGYIHGDANPDPCGRDMYHVTYLGLTFFKEQFPIN